MRLHFDMPKRIPTSRNFYALKNRTNLKIRYTYLLILCLCIGSIKSTQAQTITTIAGSFQPGFSGDGGPAINAKLSEPVSLCMDASGNLFIADAYNHRIRKITASTGIISTVAGNDSGSTGDGGPATSSMIDPPWNVCVDALGNIYFTSNYACNIRKVTAATGIISTIIGNWAPADSGDGGLAIHAQAASVWGLCADASGNVYFSESKYHKIRKITASTGIVTTICGNGSPGFSGDGGPASSAQLNGPGRLAIDASGNLYMSDNYRIRKITASTGIISTIAGNGTLGSLGDGGPATSAEVRPAGVYVDISGNIYIGEMNRIRKINIATGMINTIAGNGIQGFSGDGGMATNAQFYNAAYVAKDASGNLYIADQSNQRIRKISNNQPYCDFTYSTNNMVVSFASTNPNCTAFTWDFGNGNTSTINPNPIITYSTAGTYSPCFKCNSPVTCLSCLAITVPGNGNGGTTNMVEEQSASMFTIYPNPSHGRFNIYSTLNIQEIEIYNIFGERILYQKFSNEIDMSSSPKGIYFIKFFDGKTIYKNKIILD